MQLRILSWNIWVDCHFSELKDFLLTSDADIIGLQEVRADDPERDVIGFLDSLGYRHAYAREQFWPERGLRFGPAIFSKYDIESSTVHALSENERRIALQADIRVNDEVLHVFNTHLLHIHHNQKLSDIPDIQAETLLGLLPAEKTIVMGDFNAAPNSRVIQRMREVLNDTDPSSIPTWSVYPEGCLACNPQKIDTRLDYIFTSKDLKTHSPAVGNSKASDHLPISVILEL